MPLSNLPLLHSVCVWSCWNWSKSSKYLFPARIHLITACFACKTICVCVSLGGLKLLFYHLCPLIYIITGEDLCCRGMSPDWCQNPIWHQSGDLHCTISSSSSLTQQSWQVSKTSCPYVYLHYSALLSLCVYIITFFVVHLKHPLIMAPVTHPALTAAIFRPCWSAQLKTSLLCGKWNSQLLNY